MQKTVFVLGGDGFIGKNLCAELHNRGLVARVFDKAHFRQNLLNKADLLVLRSEFRKLAITQSVIPVVMLAANVGAERFNCTPMALADENYRIDSNVLRVLCHAAPACFSVVYASTSEVYGKPSEICVNPLRGGRSLYAQTKLIGETKLLYAAREMSNIRSVAICRLFNVSGKHQQRGVVYGMVKSAIEEGVIRYATDTTREITFVQDAVAQMAEYAVNETNGTFDVTSKWHVRLEDLAKCVKAALIRIDSSFSRIALVEMPPDAFSKDRGTVPVIRGALMLDAFTEELVKHKTVEDIFWDLRGKYHA